MNKNIVLAWKPVGLSPLQTINKFKDENMDYKNLKISYAGRLDPVAEGILVLLIEEENKKREAYLNLTKIYEAEIVLGITTDTFDGLGLVINVIKRDIKKQEIEDSTSKFVGKHKQTYPPYSSKRIGGKPLYWWSRKSKLNEIEMPEKDIEIFSLDLLDYKKIELSTLYVKIKKQILLVNGDFRQKEIVERWENIVDKYGDTKFSVIRIRINCSSGTYIRRVASDLGEKLNAGAFTLSIQRNSIGNFTKKDCFNLRINI